MIQAVIFDLDGLLIDSEPLWREVEVKVFNSLGAPVTYEMLEETHGRREDELILYWYNKFPWEGKLPQEVEQEIYKEVLELVKEKGEPEKGVREILAFLSTKNVKFAIASSSSMAFINAVVEKFGISKYFDVLHSGEFEEFGKPHPAVYLTTLEKLGISPEHAITFEDSFSGVKAAKAAHITCICVPSKDEFADPKFDIADYKISSLLDFSEEMWKKVNGESL